MTEQSSPGRSLWQPIRWILLALATIFVLLNVFSAVTGSIKEPQATSRLQLSQTDLLLAASAWQGGDVVTTDELSELRASFLGANPLKAATEQYQDVRDQTQATLTRSQAQLEAEATAQSETLLQAESLPESGGLTPVNPQLQRIVARSQALLTQLDLRLGLLNAQQDNLAAAQQTWQDIASSTTPAGMAAQVLQDLWNEPPVIPQDAQIVLQTGLDGWFQFRGLERLYTLQQRPEALTELAAQEQAIAEQAFIKLGLVGAVPVLGSIGGIMLLSIVGIRWLTRRDRAVLNQFAHQRWSVPWGGDTIIQVLIVGFFFIGQIVIPIALQLTGLRSGDLSGRDGAIQSLMFYLLMSASGLSVLYISIRPYLPLPKQEWFQVNWRSLGWIGWGVGGYLVALPLMIGVSFINQKIWQGQGGSNPLLETVLREGDGVALLIFFSTAAIAAPLFEEILFRGFLLPSLTRYVPVWGAILLSSLIFATAHLSISEVLPLTVLGCILGVVYARSRNLLAPMLLHSLWNGATMVSLFVLGSGST